MHYLGQSNIGAGLGAGALYLAKGIVVGRASRTCTWTPRRLVARIVPRGVNLGHGSHVLFHQTDLLPQLPRHLTASPVDTAFQNSSSVSTESTGSPSLHFLRIMVFLPCFPARSRPGPLIKEAAVIPGDVDPDFHLVCPGQGQVADQLVSRRKDHGQVSIIMTVILDDGRLHNVLDTVVFNSPK